MNVRIHVVNDVTVLDLEGDLDLFSAEELKKSFNAQLENAVGKLVLDMHQINYLDSMGIGALLYVFSESKKRELAFRIAGVGGTPRKVIELTKLDRYFPLMNTLEEAVRDIG